MIKFDYYIVGEGFEKKGFLYKETLAEVAEELISFLKERNLKSVKMEIKQSTKENDKD